MTVFPALFTYQPVHLKLIFNFGVSHPILMIFGNGANLGLNQILKCLFSFFVSPRTIFLFFLRSFWFVRILLRSCYYFDSKFALDDGVHNRVAELFNWMFIVQYSLK